MKTTLIMVAVLTVSLLSSMTVVEAAEDSIAAGKEKANTCVGCHGVPNMDNVYPTYKAPLIGGQQAVYIVNALKAYADGSRWHPTMQAQTKSMSEQDMADIAAYLESLENK